MQFAVVLLLVMLAAVIVSIAVSGWKLSKPLGATMFVMYAVFVGINLLVEYDVIKPPLPP